MERRHFLKFAVGFVAGAAALAASAQAAPLLPQPLPENVPLPSNGGAQPAVTTENEVERLTPEPVRWVRRRRFIFRRRYWGFRRRRLRRRRW